MSQMNRFFLTCFAGFLFFYSLYAQSPSVVELRSAQRLEGKIINNEEVRELIGNVHFVQPTRDGSYVFVWCDRALRYMEQNKLELYGNVKIVQNDAALYCQEGLYNANTRIMETHTGVRLERNGTTLTALHGIYTMDEKRSYFQTNVVLWDSTSVLTCNELFYYESLSRSIARDSVHLYNFLQQYHIYGDSLEHLERENLTIVPLHPRLVKIDTSATGIIDTTVIVSRLMKYFRQPQEILIAIDDVQMARADMAARCNYALYTRSADSILLTLHPVLWSGNNQITGDTVFIRLEENQLRRLDVHGHAMAASLSDSAYANRFNQLTGKYLTMYFRDNTLQHIDVRQTAISFYYLYDNGKPNGANKTSGDRILIDFEDGAVATIRVVSGVEGQYYPERMLHKHEAEYNLDGFRWYTNRPVRRGTMIE